MRRGWERKGMGLWGGGREEEKGGGRNTWVQILEVGGWDCCCW